MADRHVLINGLSIGGGGGFTVGRAFYLELASVRPNWMVSLALIKGKTLHEQILTEPAAANRSLLWAPPQTRKYLVRSRYERSDLTKWMHRHGVHAVLQLNGMVIPGLTIPTMSHFQDPWPFRPESWLGVKDRILAALKRRRLGQSLKASCRTGWTSNYLRDLVCGHYRYRPQHAEVFHNGIYDAWLNRPDSERPPLDSRPLEIVSVSNVDPYKRQELVIRAMPGLIRIPGLESLIYRIVGYCRSEYRQTLELLAAKLGVADHVIIEGRVGDERVAEAFKQARCFVLMSICESFGIPAIEAMSFGTPVVTSDCCAMPEVCGDAAVLSPPDDLDALTHAMRTVLLDTRQAEQLRQRGLARMKHFCWRDTAEKMAVCLEGMQE